MKRERCFHLWRLVRRYRYVSRDSPQPGIPAVGLECVKCLKRTSWPASEWDWFESYITKDFPNLHTDVARPRRRLGV